MRRTLLNSLLGFIFAGLSVHGALAAPSQSMPDKPGASGPNTRSSPAPSLPPPPFAFPAYDNSFSLGPIKNRPLPPTYSGVDRQLLVGLVLPIGDGVLRIPPEPGTPDRQRYECLNVAANYILPFWLRNNFLDTPLPAVDPRFLNPRIKQYWLDALALCTLHEEPNGEWILGDLMRVCLTDEYKKLLTKLLGNSIKESDIELLRRCPLFRDLPKLP